MTAQQSTSGDLDLEPARPDHNSACRHNCQVYLCQVLCRSLNKAQVKLSLPSRGQREGRAAPDLFDIKQIIDVDVNRDVHLTS